MTSHFCFAEILCFRNINQIKHSKVRSSILRFHLHSFVHYIVVLDIYKNNIR